MTSILHDREVAARFDALVGRFRGDVSAHDYRLEAVVRALTGLERPRVLDLGCGKGRFARHLQPTATCVVGIDLSSAMLVEGHGLPRIKGSALRLPFGDETFDAVVAVESLEHVADVDQAIREASRVLRPEGRFIVIDKNAGSLDVHRPWMPAIVVKWIDERRGLWMYPANGPVRERWFSTRRLRNDLAERFRQVEVSHLLSPEESTRRVFRTIPSLRRMTCWTATSPRRAA